MTLRDSRLRSAIDSTDLDLPGDGPATGSGRLAGRTHANREATGREMAKRLKQKRRRKDRRLLSESLEQRQLLAGPDLIGIQPNEGSLLNDGTVLNVSPNELVFRFDDNTEIDESTLSAIRITRAGEDGVFESASAMSDLGTSGAILVEFRSTQTGSLGDGVQVEFTAASRVGSSLPIITVNGNTVSINANSNPNQPTRVLDLISAVSNNAQASALVEVLQVSGSSQTSVGGVVSPANNLTLSGANSAEAATDFGTGGAVVLRLVSQIPGVEGRGTRIELQRQNFGGAANPVVLVSGQTIQVQLNSAPGSESTAADFVAALANNPDSAALVSASLQEGNLNTVIGSGTAPLAPITLTGVTDVVVEPGFVGLGDSPREVVFRFAEPLPDDRYQIDILGSSDSGLRGIDGELFQNGTDLTRSFEINLGPKVVAVVPEPVRRSANGSLSPDVGRIEVHFNDDDLNISLAQTPSFYQLIFTRDTATNLDDFVRVPNSVSYNSSTNIATLNFGGPLSRLLDNSGQVLEGAARLRVGTSEGLATAPTEVSLAINANNLVEPGDTFDDAFDLGTQWTIATGTTSSARLSSEIFNTQPFGFDLPGPDLPGTRNIRPDDPSRLTRTVPLDFLRGGADVVDGISVIQYNFAPSWLGDDPNSPGILEDRTYFNSISPLQRQRVREVIQLYSEYLGISFVEVEGAPTSDAFFSIAVGDLYGTVEPGEDDSNVVSGDGGLAVALRDRDQDGIDDLAVLDQQDFDESTDDQFGGEFFRGAFFAVGQLLGYGFADDLPQPVSQSTDFIFQPGTDNEPAFPALADILHGQFLFRPDSTDVDLYRFTLGSTGRLSVETIAERLADASLLDTTLRLYRDMGNGSFEEIAQNDDYFSNDSLIDLEVEAGTYVIGVSARGNNSYDPAIEDSGFGGLTEGEYELAIDFTPSSTNTILDTTGVALDGDGDNRPGGVFDFWFVPADSNNTIYVDKAAPAGGGPLGSVGNPFREIDQALASASPGDTVRVIGNGGIDGRLETAEDNFSYQIGFANNGLPLVDGSSLNLPQGVRMVIDSGAILKLSGSRIGVGSVSPLIDGSDAALQVLGTPSIITQNGLPARDSGGNIIPGSVIFTSINDTSIGMGNAPLVTGQPRPGDWGGIDFRGDLDAADESRRNRELEGVFLNHIQLADLRYGGGSVSIGGLQTVVSPIDMAVTRATIINSSIRDSADAAIAATPDTFAETRFTDPFFQAGGNFTPDYDRVGPNISGNRIVDNSINGLFIRVTTRTGDVLETISTTTRFDDTDIVHVLAENLVIEGTAGGPILQSSAPSVLLVQTTAVAGDGNVAPGEYVYRLTNVDSAGLESAASQATVSEVTTQTGGIRLTQLPGVAAGSDFVSRRLYRATVDPTSGLPGEFRLVSQLNASATTFVDRVASGSTLLSITDSVLRSRLDASLTLDPGTILKLDGARIEARFGANLIAEGLPGQPVVFTSLEDQRYGAGGTFDTNDRGDAGELNPGDWGGIYIGHAGSASIDQAVIAGGGGSTRIEGGFASFNAVEVHQGTLRLTNSRLEQNADGRGVLFGDRVGRSDNASGTLFARASTPIIAGNTILDGEGVALSLDLNSFSEFEVADPGRSTGAIDRSETVGNSGPLIEGNVIDGNAINGLQVRGGQLTTAGVWDDTDIVHVVTDTIEIPNQHVFGGLRLQSDGRGSLVVKFENTEDSTAGIVVGGSLETAADQLRDIPDRIGGALQVIGHPDFPVVLTTLADDTAGAGFTLDGFAQVDTNNDGISGVVLEANPNVGLLPAGPEVNNGLLIDNDVDPQIPGSFSFLPGPGGTDVVATTTSQGLTQVFQSQASLFDYGFFVDVGSDGGAVDLATTTIVEQPNLIGDDQVQSRGTFDGANGLIEWEVVQFFEDGSPDLVSEIRFTSANALGDIRFINYYDPIIGLDAGDNLFTEGTPGTDEFRVTILDAAEQIGFRQFGAFEPGNGLENATYEGWIADEFPDLIFAPEFDLPFTLEGTIDTADVPLQNLPQFPQPNFGPGIITSALAWQVDPTATTASFRTNLQLISQTFGSTAAPPVPGSWNGIVVREAASDRNVAAIAEAEPVRPTFIDTNNIPSQSQFLGEIAPAENAGDENRRLGFVIDGSITRRNDIDVYSFIGQSGTEVFLDIDRTSNRFDSVVELIDANGRVLASSNDSALGQTNPNALFVANNVNPDAAQPLTVLNERINAQEIRISESIVDATGGNITLGIAGQPTVLVPVASFLADPALAIETALETSFPDQLGDITASLNRRAERQFSSANPGIVTRFGGDFVVQLRFDADAFVGRSVPAIAVSAVGVVGPTAVTSSVSELVLGSQVQDAYSTNPKDAGFRIQLPGESGTRNLFHVRVRSSNTTNPLDFATLTDPAQVGGGLSQGNYQLQIRLSELDEQPGTQFNLADIRYASTGLQIIGQPLHSPLLGEEFEIAGDNDSLENAQPLGPFGNGNDSEANSNLLASDRAARSFAGSLSDATDVDWYSFTVNYENLTRDAAGLFFSTVFDLDYASGFARADMALYVFDANGQLILVGGDSNIADDLPGLASSSNTDDLSRGSAGAEDPFIGAAELSEGTYFVAVSNQQQVPQPLDQFFNADSATPLLRLEPIDSVTRIVEDRINFSGGGTASPPTTQLLFDNESIVDYTLDDVLLYVNTGTSLVLVNPFTGQNYGTVGNFGDEIEEVAFRSTGELFAYSGFNNRVPTDDNFFYYRIDTGSGALSAPLSVGAGVATFDETVDGDGQVGIVDADVGLNVEATTIAQLGGQEAGFFVANRFRNSFVDPALNQYTSNVLYSFQPATGLANGSAAPFNNRLVGAGTLPREVGQIQTAPQGALSTHLGITAPVEIDASGNRVASLVDGDTFTLSDGTDTFTFEIDSGVTLTSNPGIPILDGDQITVDSQVFEFNTGVRLQLSQAQPTGSLSDGTLLELIDSTGATVVFEFTGDGQVAAGNLPINILNATGQPIPAASLALTLVGQINDAIPSLQAVASGDQVTFNGPIAPSIDVTGSGISQVGDATVSAGAIGVNVSEFSSPSTVVQALVQALQSAGVSVVSDGAQLSLPDSGAVTLNTLAFSTTGNSGTGANVPVLAFPGDTASIVAQRISLAVSEAFGPGSTIAVVPASPSGRSLQVVNGLIVSTNSANGAIVEAGLGQDGIITGAELVTETNGVQNLYALDDNGGLYVVSGGLLTTSGARQLGTPVATATDLIRLGQSGVNFSGLRSGPISFNGGELRQTLFGITTGGDIYAFNTAGELQNIFAGGRSVISTGVAGARGLDFSTLGFNLWHTTNQRGFDAGHGVNEIFNGTRVGSNGGTSLAFNYEAGAFSGNFPSAERPVILNNDGSVSNPRQDGTAIEDTFNLPGGAKGAIQSNTFSLDGYSADDQPTLYFNYFLETDESDSIFNDRDALRVFVVTPDGVQHLVASNNTARGVGSFDDEFDDPAPFGLYDDDIDVDVQQLFDNTGSWRQARVPVGSFAGLADLSLRIEFASAGTTSTGSLRLQTTSGAGLIDGDTFTIDGEVFSVDLAPAVSVPSGPQLAAFYVDPAALATITIDGQDYVLDDGNRTGITTEIPISLVTGTTGSISELSAADIAALVTDAVRLSPPPNQLVEGLLFTEPQDIDPTEVGGRNDRTFEAIALPYNGGNVTFVGQGQLGNDALVGDFDNSDPNNLTFANTDDVDLFRLELGELSSIDVNVTGDDAIQLPVEVAIRLFDADGVELQTGLTVGNTRSFSVAEAGTYFIGISGQPNVGYNPLFDTGTAQGRVGNYEATFAVNANVAIQQAENLVELSGLQNVTAGPSGLFTISGQAATVGIPVPISRLMTASQVASEVQKALADRFASGILDAIPTQGSSLLVAGFSIDDAGPFVNASQRFGDQFGASPIAGAQDNEFEGVYLDDFIIGFAERGEIATGDTGTAGDFITDARPGFSNPPAPTSDLDTGSYQVEIRGASEFVNSGANSTFRTFDTNTRLSESRFIDVLPAAQLRDGATFRISDGRSTVTFEFDQVEAASGVSPGNVRVPFTLRAIAPGSESIDPVTGLAIPGTGLLRPQTAAEVAASIVEAINRSEVQSIIDVPALPSSGIDGGSTSRINLFGEVVINNDGGGLAGVGRGDLRGDDNRDRDAQGVIIVENSRVIFSEAFGISLDHGLTANVAGTDGPALVRYPRNLVELNTESIRPGVVVQSNVIAFNGLGGLQINGIDNAAGDTESVPVAFDRIVNNTIIGGSINAGIEAPPATVQGVLFEQGLISFADAVVPNSFQPNAGGAAPDAMFQNANAILGAPQVVGRGIEPVTGEDTVSLGLGGTITVQFTDNLLTGSGDARADLIIYETGAVESVLVEISRDGSLFQNVGIVGGLTNTVDLDAFGFGTQDRFAFVRLTDLRQGDTNTLTLGADIDAVGALSSVPVEVFAAGGVGISLTGNAAPALLNNVISNSETGFTADAASPLTILGGNTYYRNTTNVPDGFGLGQFSQELADAEVIFVAASDLVFAPSAGASIIDSSIDSLEDRASLTTVRNPLGLPPSPILAPRLDANGQLRVDDPNVETPSGLGERVFSDRGALDRGDLVGPRVVLLSPSADNLGTQAGVVSVFGQAPLFFELQLIDGLAPADVVPGTGIDDRTVSPDSILLLQDNVPLTEGIDYRFGYNPSTNVIRLTPIAGVWEPDSTYLIRMIDGSDAIVRSVAGNAYTDGDVLNVLNLQGDPIRFEYETGITVSFNPGTIQGGTADGIIFDVFDGVNRLNFELDDDGIVALDSIAVIVPVAGNDSELATALAAAINASGLNLTATADDLSVQIEGTNPLSSVQSNQLLTIVGTIGTEQGFGFQIPSEDGGIATTLADGQTFIVRRGASVEAVFELSSDGIVDTEGATPIEFNTGQTLDQLALQIVNTIGGSGLGLAPVNAGFGRIVLGGDSTFSLELENSVFTQIGFPGQGPTTPIVIGIEQTDLETAAVIAAAIESEGIATTIADTRILLEGTGGVNGVGAVDTVTVSDEVGNQLQSNQPNGRTELTIFVGGGFDYGDAPAPYASSDVDNGPRHAVNPGFSIGVSVSPDSNAVLPNGDDDNGVSVNNLRAGFSSTLTVQITNDENIPFFLDAWFDWNGNANFEADEALRFGSAGTGRAVLGNGLNSILLNVPGDAVTGETFARFRLSPITVGLIGPTGDALTATGDFAIGEVEDIPLLIANNPFQNPRTDTVNFPAQDLRKDVNDSGQITPLDALNIINALGRAGGVNQGIQLDVAPLPAFLPPFPDVNGDGMVTALDALLVINELANTLPNANGEQLAEGESVSPPVAQAITAADSIGFASVSPGVLASGATRIGDLLIAETQQPAPEVIAPTAVSKTSVFDSPQSVQLDSIVDSLAEDTSASRLAELENSNVRDQLFASF